MDCQITLLAILQVCALVGTSFGLSCYTCHNWDTEGSDTSNWQVNNFINGETRGNDMKCLRQGDDFVNNRGSPSQQCYLQDRNNLMRCLSFKGVITMKMGRNNIKLNGAVRKCIEIPRRYAARMPNEAYHCTKESAAVMALYNNKTNPELSMIEAMGDFCGCNTTHCNTGEVVTHAHHGDIDHHGDHDHQEGDHHEDQDHHEGDHDHQEGDDHDHEHHHEMKDGGHNIIPDRMIVSCVILIACTLGLFGFM